MDVTDFDQLFPGRFIKAGEFQGKDVTLTIEDVNLEDLTDKMKGVIKFKETKKGFVLNRTNGESIKAMFGRKPQDWVGKRITLYPGEWNGEPAIRVKGSPDITDPVEFELKLFKRRPLQMRMVPTGKKVAA